MKKSDRDVDHAIDWLDDLLSDYMAGEAELFYERLIARLEICKHAAAIAYENS